MKHSEHPIICHYGKLAFEGYENIGDYFCVVADNGNHFVENGIISGSLLIVDPNKEFQKDELNIYQSEEKSRKQRKFRISREKLDDYLYVGRVVIAINQYGGA